MSDDTAAATAVGVDDDLLDDLMSIVHHNEGNAVGGVAASGCENSQSSLMEHGDDGDEGDEDAGASAGGVDDDEDEANSIDEMLEKPIDILDDKKDDQVNFYTYDKIQIKS